MPISITKLPQTPNARRRFIALITIGIFLHLILLVFVIAFLRVQNPEVRVRSITVENLTVNSTNSTVFSITLNAQVIVRNTNFGRFKFPDSPVSILHQGNAGAGTGVIPADIVGARSAEKVNVTVAVEFGFERDPFLGPELSSGRVVLSCRARMEGRVRVFKIVTRKKTATMDCTMDVETRSRAVENLRCK